MIENTESEKKHMVPVERKIRDQELIRNYKHTKRKKNLPLKHTHSRKAIFVTAINKKTRDHDSLKWEIYRLTVPFEGKTLVCVSAANMPTMFGRIFETYVFPAKKMNGKFEIEDFGELYGIKEINDHVETLEDMGYRLIGRPNFSTGNLEVPLLES